MKFSDIPGLSTIKHSLVKAVQNNKTPHAYLFFGREGALILPLALAYTTYLHCQNKSKNDACGLCPSCHKNGKYIHPDTCFIFPYSIQKKDNNEEYIRMNILKLWRTFLLEQPFGKYDDWIMHYGGESKNALISRSQSREISKILSLKSFESPYKVVIIWHPEHMHPTAANSILKILEEPPTNTVFILVSNAIEKLLSTIKSRVQEIQVPLLGNNDISLFLHQKTHIDEYTMKTILYNADGDLNTALQLAQNNHNPNQHHFIDWMRACFKKDYKQIVNLADEFHKSDKIKQQNILKYSISMIREALLYLAKASSLSRLEKEQAKYIQNFSSILNITKIEKLNEIFTNASHYLKQNGSAKMIFLAMSLECSIVLNPIRTP